MSELLKTKMKMWTQLAACEAANHQLPSSLWILPTNQETQFQNCCTKGHELTWTDTTEVSLPAFRQLICNIYVKIVLWRNKKVKQTCSRPEDDEKKHNTDKYNRTAILKCVYAMINWLRLWSTYNLGWSQRIGEFLFLFLLFFWKVFPAASVRETFL